jgi:hypothetical protein
VLLRRGCGSDDNDDRWIQVPADPSAFFIIVGDALQVSASCVAAHSFEDKLAHYMYSM